MGVDVLADDGDDEVFDRSQIVVPGPSSTDELQIRYVFRVQWTHRNKMFEDLAYRTVRLIGL